MSLRKLKSFFCSITLFLQHGSKDLLSSIFLHFPFDIISSSSSDFTNPSNNGLDLKLQQAKANPLTVNVGKDASSKFKTIQEAEFYVHQLFLLVYLFVYVMPNST